MKDKDKILEEMDKHKTWSKGFNIDTLMEYSYFPVFGGWIGVIVYDKQKKLTGCCFIPDPEHDNEPVPRSFESIGLEGD